jgi:hypothetical protein
LNLLFIFRAFRWLKNGIEIKILQIWINKIFLEKQNAIWIIKNENIEAMIETIKALIKTSKVSQNCLDLMRGKRSERKLRSDFHHSVTCLHFLIKIILLMVVKCVPPLFSTLYYTKCMWRCHSSERMLNTHIPVWQTWPYNRTALCGIENLKSRIVKKSKHCHVLIHCIFSSQIV